MNLIEYAKKELALVGDQEINRDILAIIELFESQGHSGFSAEYAINFLERLLRFKPLTPLTGESDEWTEVAPHGAKQNKRCSSVFLKKDGIAHDIDGIVVSDNGGITWFQSNRFRKQVTFPYYPPAHPEEIYIEYTEYVPPGFSGDKYEIITDQPERIRALRERKRREFDEARIGHGKDELV